MRSIFMKILGATMLLSPLFPGRASYAAGGPFGSWCSGPVGFMGGYGMGWFGPLFMMAFWVLILTGIFFVIKWIIRALAGDKRPIPRNDSSALEILKERYARGEIDRENFETMKQQIEQA